MSATAVDKTLRRSTMTPWGPADELRMRQLRPGPGTGSETVERNQRERIYGGMVAAVAEHGYEATRVADVLVLAGVSRSAFYRYFKNKSDCFLATLEATAELARDQLAQFLEDAEGDGERQLAALFDAVIEIVLEQPAAARAWLVEAHSAGPEAVELVERVAGRLEAHAAQALAAPGGGAGLPPDGLAAILGGLRQIVRARLRRDQESDLPALAPELLRWALGYGTPPQKLSRRRRPPALPTPTPEPDDQRRRILTAVTELVAEAGYQELTITEIASRAEISLTTFYDRFESKRDAFVAAIDDGERQLVEIALPAYRGAPDWPRATRDTIFAFFAFYATHPQLAQLGGRRIFSGGDVGFERHEQTTGRFGAMLEEGFALHPEVGPVVGEAIAGSVATLVYQQIRDHGPERLYEVAALATYLTLAPFVGPASACELANAGWRPPRP
jgi:AcrR family transcriptional regulator